MADDEKSPKNPTDKVKQEDGKNSLDTLKKAQPSENISIGKSLEGKSEEVLEKVMGKSKAVVFGNFTSHIVAKDIL
nr:unnamed protein product [Callosobruchus analis]